MQGGETHVVRALRPGGPFLNEVEDERNDGTSHRPEQLGQRVHPGGDHDDAIASAKAPLLRIKQGQLCSLPKRDSSGSAVQTDCKHKRC